MRDELDALERATVQRELELGDGEHDLAAGYLCGLDVGDV
jgi:hypothetical protein